MFAFAWVLEARAAGAQVTAVVEPEEISLGEAAHLTVLVEGAVSVTEPQFPQIDGLEIRRITSSTNYQFGTGGAFASTTYIYQLFPRKTGVFTIPELTIRAGRELVKTPPLTLRVAKPYPGYSGPSVQTPAQAPTVQGTASPPPPSPQTPAPAELSSEPVAFQINVPKRDFYVGELVPAELKVFLRQGLNISDVFTPTLSGNAYTIGKLPTQPDAAEDQMFGGNLYKVLTWHTTVAPVKAGEYPLSVRMDVLVVEQVRRRSPFGDDVFNDPFFDRFFRGEQKRKVTLASKDTQVKILTIPEEGKPADFSGAIGQFELTADASPKEVAVGDPVTLKLIVAGSGNFDRVKAPELGKNLGFKVYPPSAKFEPFDSAGQGGRKTFEQLVIPQNTSVASIPRISFIYFDPNKGKYVTLASNEIPLRVTGATSAGSAPSSAPAAVPSATSPAKAQPQPGFTASDNNLIPNKLQQGEVISSLHPFCLQPWFLGLQAIPLAGLVLAWWIFRRRDRLKKDPAFARSVSASRAVQVQLAELEKALALKNSQDFFTAVRRVLQERLGEKTGMKPETITPSDLVDWSSRMNHASEDRDETIEEVRKIFEIADAVSYSGQRYDAESLGDWKNRVLNALKRLEKFR